LSERVAATLTVFGGGVLFAAVALEVVPEADAQAGVALTAAGLAAGTALYVGADAWVDRNEERGETRRMMHAAAVGHRMEMPAELARGESIAAGIFIDGVPESPDERFLYVGDWDPSHKAVMRYPIADDGSAGGRESCSATSRARRARNAIDGVKVRGDGRLYVCGPGGIWVLSPQGERLEPIELPETPHNLAWGPDERTLYVTALTSIYRIRLEETR
jgi:sugar lactone lactonase YvrE